MTRLPDRYRRVISKATDLAPGERVKLLAVLEALYEIYADPPPPIDDSGSVWF